MLREAAEAKARAEAERERQKEARRNAMNEKRQLITSNMSMTEMARFADSKAREFERRVKTESNAMLNERGMSVKGACEKFFYASFSLFLVQIIRSAPISASSARFSMPLTLFLRFWTRVIRSVAVRPRLRR